MKKRCLVVEVTAPKVAHSQGQWEVTVVFGQRIGTYLKRIKRTVFTTFQPTIGDWIEVNFL